MQLIKYLR